MKNLIQKLNFYPKENAADIFIKKYADNYVIEIDFHKEIINYGNKIVCENKTTSNFSQPENFVVLECVNRLLEKGYKPKNIILEKTWQAGHGTSGRLDICVTRDDGSEYLLIECKTYGKEFDKEFARMKKDGGQLFTYFKFSNKADVIMLYASELKGKEIVYRNEIVKIEDDYRSGDVKDFYQKWNKLTKDNGVFDSWVESYNFESKALTPKLLKPIQEDDSSLIFNQFLEILRHNVVSDKPNAFNKIFTLFLCKVYDEKTTKPNEELKFQWIEGKDADKGENAFVDFLIRLSDLYKNGMLEFLEKEITDFSEVDFERKYKHLDDSIKKDLLKEFNKIRLEKNNEFAIKEVFDKQSFLENGKIVKEVVELLQGFRIRYNKRQQYLSNFFELLLTTGLKQESGQFFTPVPVAQFIIKSLPIDAIVNEKLQKGTLPYLIDYAAGSGHFLTESMHEIQKIINEKTNDEFTPIAQEKIIKWQNSHFDWATQFVYGIEKDYRLVKVGKVGCYLHGDGLANVLLSDGLGSFKTTKEYKGLLKETKEDFPQDNGQFDILISNPPYSVSSFKRTTTDYYTSKDFKLYDKLTDNSSEIECLFIERTKQLLKDGGVAGIILPSSILSNTGIYSKSREIILQYFDIVAITELGSNTFMATGTNTVTLFLRRRNNYESRNLKIAVEKFFTDFQDVTIKFGENYIERPFSKYVNHAWNNESLRGTKQSLFFEDYISLLKKEPNKTVTEHEIYKEYQKKLKSKNEKEFFNLLLEKELDKLYYFIIAYPQKVVLVKSGEKDAEKRFLGYEFSNRRGSEGIHPIQRGKNIEDCTQLFDAEVFENPTKASTYIYKAFAGDYDFPIDEAMQNNISRHDLVDMLTFDRADFEKNISLSVKKKVKIESKWEIIDITNVAKVKNGFAFKSDEYVDNGFKVIRIKNVKNGFIEDNEPVFISLERENEFKDYVLKNEDILVSMTGNPGRVAKIKEENLPALLNQRVGKFEIINKNLLEDYFYHFINTDYFEKSVVGLAKGLAQLNVSSSEIESIKIPLPPLDIQQKIVSEIEVLEAKEKKTKEEVEELNLNIQTIINKCFSNSPLELIGNICYSTEYGSSSKSEKTGLVPVIRMGNIQNGKILLNDLVYSNNIEENEKYLLKYNDVLFNRTNSPELVGKTGIYQSNEPAIFAGYLIRINYKEDLVLPVYLNYVLNSETIRNYGFSVMTKSVNQANINGTILKSYKIPLPPLSEQQKIVSEIEKIEAKIKTIETEIATIPKQKEAILKKYL